MLLSFACDALAVAPREIPQCEATYYSTNKHVSLKRDDRTVAGTSFVQTKELMHKKATPAGNGACLRRWEKKQRPPAARAAGDAFIGTA
jgi:hypothetical protein